ncbi:hypothetical protein SLA2020_069970 [Shorea laevis]
MEGCGSSSRLSAHDIFNARVDIDWLKKETCIRCNRGGRALVCTETGCPIALHENCMHGKPEFDSFGPFYCPLCTYKQPGTQNSKFEEKDNVGEESIQTIGNEDMTIKGKVHVGKERFSRFYLHSWWEWAKAERWRS